MSDEEQLRILLSILGQTDALFVPVRRWDQPHWVSGVVEARRQFFQEGLPISIRDRDTTDRHEAERILDALDAAGDVQFRRRAGKRVTWRLRDATDWRLRRLGCGSDWWEMMTVIAAIHAHETTPHPPETNMVPEAWLADGKYFSRNSRLFQRRLLAIEDVLAPALCRDLVRAWSDRDGRVAYSLTDYGRSLLADPKPPAVVWPKYSSAASDMHFSAFKAAMMNLQGLRGSDSHACIPLSSGCWPEQDEAPDIPPVFLRGGERIRSLPDMWTQCRKAEESRK